MLTRARYTDEVPPTFIAACPLCGTTEADPLVAFAELSFVSCRHCGLIYKREQVAGLAERYYDETYFRQGSSQYLKRWRHRVAKCKRQLLTAREYMTVAGDLLDVGCSAGYMLEAGRSLGMNAEGLDCSSFAVELCRERGYCAQQGELEAMPFEDQSFDIVVAKHTLEHVARPLAALEEVRRMLRPGGVVFLVVPNAEYWKRYWLTRRGRYFRPDRAGWQHHVYFATPQLEDACERSGLEPLKAGKAILRRRRLRSLSLPWELSRYAAVATAAPVARALHLSREVQLIARRPERDKEAEDQPGNA